MSLRDDVAAFEDVREELIEIPMWGNTKVLFRGLSYAAVVELEQASITAAQEGDIASAIRIVQATACDPETGQLAFSGPEGEAILKKKSSESIVYCLTKGSNLVLGVDEEQLAGKDSSSTAKETKTLDA